MLGVRWVDEKNVPSYKCIPVTIYLPYRAGSSLGIPCDPRDNRLRSKVKVVILVAEETRGHGGS